MKKLFLFFAAALLIGCMDYTDDFNAIDERLDKLEQAVPSIEEQIESINAQLTSLKATDDAIKAQISELEKSDQVAVASDIADLKKKNSALEKSINDLQNYVDTQITNAKSEAAAAYATIEQYNTIVAQLNALQSSTTKLGEDLTAKINTEVASLNGRIADLEARLKAVEDKVENLLARIQSVSYIPTYSDGKATLEYTDSESKVTLDFEISPKDAVAELAKVWDGAISVKAVYTQTRAVSFVDMPIISFEADATNGVISVTASGENLSEEFFAGTQEASVAISISDGKNSVISEYIQMIVKCQHLDVTPNNISGVWRMDSYDNGVQLSEGIYYYIVFDRAERTFITYDNLASMGLHKNSGRYDITTDMAAVIRGMYDDGQGYWEYDYYIRDLTQYRMVWVAVDDESIVTVFVRAELPEYIYYF